MIHNIRRKDGTVYPLDVEIASGVLAKNGREIFEGDIVKVDDVYAAIVTFMHDALGVESISDNCTIHSALFASEFEIVEHDDT